MVMYNLTEYSNNYSKTSGSFWQYCRYEPYNKMTDSKSFNFKSKFSDNTDNISTVNVEVAILLKINFVSTLCHLPSK